MELEILQQFISAKKSTRDIAAALGISQTTVRHWLKKHKLKTTPERFFLCKCGETNPEKFYGNKKRRCGNCHNAYTMDAGKKKRDWAIEYLGGCCSIKECGFSKYKSALDVHHLDRAKKDPNFGSMRGWSIARIEKELQHCRLLCKCCHAALHAGELKLDGE